MALPLGFVLGLRHALDADHVVAVSTLASQHRSVVRSCLLGTFWGAGHTAALLAVSLLMIVFKVTISPALERSLETAVGVVLVLLGGHVLLRVLGDGTLHAHEHAHGGRPHRHWHVHLGAAAGTEESHGHTHLLRLGGRPFLVGLLHGMAGSAALMLLALAAIPSPLGILLYVLVFGVGSTLGMLVVSGLIGLPMALTAGRSRAAHVGLQVAAGAASVALGLWLVWEVALAG
jgi:high-affinity nickel permease